MAFGLLSLVSLSVLVLRLGLRSLVSGLLSLASCLSLSWVSVWSSVSCLSLLSLAPYLLSVSLSQYLSLSLSRPLLLSISASIQPPPHANAFFTAPTAPPPLPRGARTMGDEAPKAEAEAVVETTDLKDVAVEVAEAAPESSSLPGE